MSKPAKILLGIATLLPIVYMIFFFFFILSAFSSIHAFPRNARFDEGAFTSWLSVILPLHILAMLLTFGLTIFYMVNVFRNDRVAKDKKTLWAVVIFLGNVLAMPVYWYLYIWRESEDPSAAFRQGRGLNNAVAPDMLYDAALRERERDHFPPPPPSTPPDWRQ